MVAVGVWVNVAVGLAVTVDVVVAVSVGLEVGVIVLPPDGTMICVTTTAVLVFVGNGVNVKLAGGVTLEVGVKVRVWVGLVVWVLVRVGVLVRVIVAVGVRVEVGTRVRVRVGPPIVGNPVETTVGRIKVGTTVGVGVASPCAKLLSGAMSTIPTRPMRSTAHRTGVEKMGFTLGIIRYWLSQRHNGSHRLPLPQMGCRRHALWYGNP